MPYHLQYALPSEDTWHLLRSYGYFRLLPVGAVWRWLQGGKRDMQMSLANDLLMLFK